MNANKQARRHWTERNTKDFFHRVAFDFVAQIEELLEAGKISQADLAKALGVTEGRVSQVLNNPGNLGLESAVKYARALQRKVALVLYDDHDPGNQNGPVSSDIFSTCWERAGRPTDVYALQNRSFTVSVNISISIVSSGPVLGNTVMFSSGPQAIIGGTVPESFGVPLLWGSQFGGFTSTLGSELLLPNMVPASVKIPTADVTAPKLLQ